MTIFELVLLISNVFFYIVHYEFSEIVRPGSNVLFRNGRVRARSHGRYVHCTSVFLFPNLWYAMIMIDQLKGYAEKIRWRKNLQFNWFKTIRFGIMQCLHDVNCIKLIWINRYKFSHK